MAETSAKLLAKQQQMQRVIERSIENFKRIGRNNLSPARIRARISSLKESWVQFLDGDAELTRVISEAHQATISYFKDGLFEKTQEKYLDALDYMAEALEQLEPPVILNQSLNHTAGQAATCEFPLSHMPAISLPPFNGDYDKWENFRDRFTSLVIQNKDLRHFARMQYLVSCLTGNALECISDLKITAENFELAWRTLTDNFENKRRLIGVHMAALLGLPGVPRESASDLRSLLNKANFAVAALNNLQRAPANLWHDILVHLVIQKADSTTRKAWNAKAAESEELLSFDDLCKFLKKRALALEEFLPAAANASQSQSAGFSRHCKVHATTASAAVPVTALKSVRGSMQCPVCKGRHFFSACPSFVNGNPGHRRELVRRHTRCFNCLSHDHVASNCQSKYSCRSCKQKHHSMLHMSPDADPVVVVTTPSNSQRTSESQPEINSLLTSTIENRAPANVLLATAWMTVFGSSGRSLRVRALLDQGSQMTFISENVAQFLRLKRFRMPVGVSALGGAHVGAASHASEILIAPIASQTPLVAATALILPHLTSYAPCVVTDISPYDYLLGLPLADPKPASLAPIQIMLGADVFGDIILDGLRKGQAPGMPLAQKTIFGWIVTGPLCSRSGFSHSTVADTSPQSSWHLSVHHISNALTLEDEVHRFWQIEEIPSQYIMSKEDAICEQHFLNTHSRTPDGRYVVRLPFKSVLPIDIGESRSRALQLLTSLSLRLNKNSQLSADYHAFMDEYVRLGHMRPAPAGRPTRTPRVFIPHHPVVRADSLTTRLRVVFNASSMTTNGTCFNDHVLPGPKLQADLPSIILRWRQYRFVCTADICKMFRQILIDPRDLDYQCLLWQPKSADAPIEYQLCTVTYGTACAPYLALRVLQQLVVDDGERFPLGAAVLRNHLYVDDVLFGGSSTESLRQVRDELIALLRLGGFELRKWSSNSPILLEDLDSANHGLACSKTLSPDEKLKLLGVGWSPSRDVFYFKISLLSEVPRTKRSILSAIARLYDPLGWVTPVTISAKMVIQQLWKLKIGWDDVVPPSTFQPWSQIYSKLSCLNGLEIQRWTGFEPARSRVEIHGFADASSAAYAAAVYLKITSDSGHVNVVLVAGRSKVAPLKIISIPRLELVAAVLLARLVEFVSQSLQLDNPPCFCWSDSTVVLSWLAKPPNQWKPFVANRVADIRTRLPNASWRHVSTHDNPADCASRGLLGDALESHDLWWHGPSWLLYSPEEWPMSESPPAGDASLEARAVALHCEARLEPCDLADRFSSWPKLIRVTAYVFRFVSRCRCVLGEHSSIALTSLECQVSTEFWIKRIQAMIFSDEIVALTKGKDLPSRSSLLKLRPFLDNEGILRVGGRLRNAPIPYATRCPILLASHPLVRLLVANTHIRLLHSGLQLTLSSLRRHYWILRARSIVKAEIFKCVICTRERAVIPTQLMGDLPSVRVSAPKRSFMHCGLDYAGPVFIRASPGRGIKSRKAYIALFVCLATRAIHLELVTDYSTPAFLNAYSRFCSRRGLPQTVYSDNGTTFVGADREMTAAYRSALRDPDFQNRTAMDRVTWHFIPPSAPHFGGLWEAGVRSVKHHLRRVLGSHMLTYEEFSTLLCRIEACLNSRPLAPLSDSLDNYDFLTPGHFLIGSAITMTPEPSTLELNENRLSRWQLVHHMTERFWKQWQNDYVNTLQQRGKWQKTQTQIKVGQLVLLRNSLLPPCKWELGRVTCCHPGADELTRVVTVKTASSEYKRPISKICVLPVTNDSND